MTTYRLFIERCGPLAIKLQKAGHDILAIVHAYNIGDMEDSPVPVICEQWPLFEMGSIKKFDPDRVIVWNGKFPHLHAATMWLRSHYKVFIVEMGWYPQKDNSYISDELAQISGISKVPYQENVASSPKNQRRLEKTRAMYNTDLPDDLEIPTYYIFIPFQIEHDTQITETSSYIKSMNSLIGYVRMLFPEIPIIIRRHPLWMQQEVSHFLHDVIDYGDKASSLSLALKSTMTIGINSTVLSETMLFRVPTITLGEHVGKSVLGISASSTQELFKRLLHKDGYFEATFTDLYDYRSLVLLHNQWDFRNPPNWVIDKILSDHTAAPRIPLP